MVYKGKSESKMDDVGVLLFQETSILLDVGGFIGLVVTSESKRMFYGFYHQIHVEYIYTYIYIYIYLFIYLYLYLIYIYISTIQI